MQDVKPWGHDFERGEDGWIRHNGADYPNVIQAFYFDRMKFCGCGDPVAQITFLRDTLHALSLPFKKAQAEYGKLFSCEAFETHYSYWLDSIRLTEHGGSLYSSWLSDEGRQVLAMLNAADDLEEAMDTP